MLTAFTRTAFVQAPPAPEASGRPNFATSCTSAEVWWSSQPENILTKKKKNRTEQNKKKTWEGMTQINQKEREWQVNVGGSRTSIREGEREWGMYEHLVIDKVYDNILSVTR